MAFEKRLTDSKAFKDNFGKILVWSGLYNDSWVYPRIAQLVFMIHTVFLAYTVKLANDDIKLMAESAHFTVMRISILVVMSNSTQRKSDLETVFTELSQNIVHDYGNSLNEQCRTAVNSRRKNCDERKNFYGNTFARLSSTVIISFWLRTLMEFYNGHLNNPPRNDGVNENLPVSSYMPYESAEWPGYHFAFLCEIWLVMQSFFTIMGIDCSFICLSEEFLRELDIIMITLNDINPRSKHLREEMKYKITQKESVHNCLKHSVQHHQNLIMIFSHLQRYWFYSLFCMLSGGAFLICLSSLMMTSDEISFKDKGVFFILLLNECVHIFIFCYYGELIMNKSIDVGDCLYNCGWTGIGKYVKPFYLMIKLRCQKPLSLSAGGFMTAGYETYGNVLRTAYSYLNLLTATN